MDIVAYALSKKFTSDTSESLGSLKGAPCTVSDVKFDKDGNSVITLKWTGTSGTIQTRDVIVQKGTDGENGVSVKDVIIRDKHLIIILSDDTEIDAGEMDAGAELSEDTGATWSDWKDVSEGGDEPFKGTEEEWDALSDDEKAKFQTVIFTDGDATSKGYLKGELIDTSLYITIM